ncbi:MAG: hypothetical protein WB586_26220 [Chthoniobacterales bacterium]
MTKTTDKIRRIAELNDLCRTAMGLAGRLVQAAGINALPLRDQSAIREKIERFDLMISTAPTIRMASATLEPSCITARRFCGRSIITRPTWYAAPGTLPTRNRR